MSKFKNELKCYIEERWCCQITSIQFNEEDSHAEYFTVEMVSFDGQATIDTYKVTKGDGDMIEEGRVYSQSLRSEDWYYEGSLSSDL
ncbi:hypothetical protein [Brevibacillus brevis]|uniref:Uncharacterized protein n=1 Tax=Brevibacillus brevis TaxID=1393 RepID=A0ABY9TCV2_BREBE|nr:hypothetical protein [Brevibacillus brevis]WNC17940.1 hypothetical protein RGB73_30255 [Brevibacillus brevis]